MSEVLSGCAVRAAIQQDEADEQQYFRDIRTGAVLIYWGEAAMSEPPHDGVVMVVDHGGDVWAVPDATFGEFFEHCERPAWASRMVRDAEANDTAPETRLQDDV